MDYDNRLFVTEPFLIFESDYLLAIDKPSGLPSVPISPSESQTAVHWVLNLRPELRGIGPASEPKRTLEPAILHRLDTQTSGVLLFAKSQAQFLKLKEFWQTDAVTKIYQAIVQPLQPNLPISLNSSTILTPIGHDAKSKKRMVALTPEKLALGKRRFRGPPLQAHTEILEITPIQKKLNPTTPEDLPLYKVTVAIKTGVMHQIRVHLASVGLPILGDPLYGKKNIQAERATSTSHPPHEGNRMWLHAWKIIISPNALIHSEPRASKPIVIQAPLPAEME